MLIVGAPLLLALVDGFIPDLAIYVFEVSYTAFDLFAHVTAHRVMAGTFDILSSGNDTCVPVSRW